MRGSDWGALLGALLIVAMVIFGIWAHFSAPCGLYKYSHAGDVPARCVMNK